jgi:hypothetical protein
MSDRFRIRWRPLAAAIAVAAGISAIAHPASASTDAGSPACEAGGHRPVMDPFVLYGSEMSFDVQRNGESVGRHTVAFARRGGELIAESRFDVTVRVVGIAVYRYTYASTDVWRGGCLISSRTDIDDDGDRSVIEAVREGQELVIRGPSGTVRSRAAIVSTNHWYAGVLGDRQVLNTLTGTIDDVVIVDRGADIKRINGANAPVRRYAYTGALSTEVWYDDHGRWTALRFAGRDGSVIDFVCQRCAADVSARR